MSKLDDILTDAGATLYCKGQDWSKANPNASEVDGVCDKAKQEIKDLILELIGECTYAGELNADSTARRHDNGIIDPIELRKKVEEL